MNAPIFSRQELREIWNALAQYIENHECSNEEHAQAPAAAVSAQDKLDLFMAASPIDPSVEIETNMKPGTYRLTRDLPAFEPDKRKRHDWRAAPMKAGTLFYVTESFKGSGLRVFTGPWSHHDIAVLDFPEGSLVSVDETPSQWLRREHSGMRCAPGILDTLVKSGAITLADVQAAYATWNDAPDEDS